MALSRRSIADPTAAPSNAARHTAAIPSTGVRPSSGMGVREAQPATARGRARRGRPPPPRGYTSRTGTQTDVHSAPPPAPRCRHVPSYRSEAVLEFDAEDVAAAADGAAVLLVVGDVGHPSAVRLAEDVEGDDAVPVDQVARPLDPHRSEERRVG